MIESATAAAESLRHSGTAIGLSQSKLARLSGVSRFKLCSYELGSGSLTTDELRKAWDAFKAESVRLRNVLISSPSNLAGVGAIDA